MVRRIINKPRVKQKPEKTNRQAQLKSLLSEKKSLETDIKRLLSNEVKLARRGIKADYRKQVEEKSERLKYLNDVIMKYTK